VSAHVSRKQFSHCLSCQAKFSADNCQLLKRKNEGIPARSPNCRSVAFSRVRRGKAGGRGRILWPWRCRRRRCRKVVSTPDVAATTGLHGARSGRHVAKLALSVQSAQSGRRTAWLPVDAGAPSARSCWVRCRCRRPARAEGRAPLARAAVAGVQVPL
jgi:hypothetical protein